MMNLHFYKYQGTGNDFILFDNRQGNLQLTNQQVAYLCNRRFGIGADGLMLLEAIEGFDFNMVYYNADGGLSTMCGNGGRCITAFAKKLGIIQDKAQFKAVDGGHIASFNSDGTVNLHMQDVTGIQSGIACTILNTGSPHYVQFVDDVKATDVFSTGSAIRNRSEYQPKGINVNFVQAMPDGSIWVRTYERGVEDETLSCGTGVTASAIANSGEKTGTFETKIYTPGGELKVSFEKDTATSAKHVVLTGPATFVYEGAIKL